jgi:hypothetical protein
MDTSSLPDPLLDERSVVGVGILFRVKNSEPQTGAIFK